MRIPHVVLVDCTLREGNQTPGASFSVRDTVSIAESLVSAGITTIEVAHPCASPQEFERVQSVKSAGLPIDVLGHARAHRRDVDAVAEAGADWVGIFAGVNDLSQQNRLRRSSGEILEAIDDSIGYAVKNGVKVRFTVEDSSRTKYQDLKNAYQVAISAGASRLGFADSVGVSAPTTVRRTLQRLRRDFPQTEFEAHFHDDRGLALANALEAVQVGVSHISCAVNGLGERSGVTDTCVLSGNLQFMGLGIGVNCQLLPSLSDLVARTTANYPDKRRPVVGRDSFTHTSRLHRLAVARDPRTYEWTPATQLGRISETIDNATGNRQAI